MTDYAAVAAQVRHDLCRHQLGEREHVIVDLILRLSLDIGRAFARIPRLEDVTACVGISKGNVSTIFENLVNARIISIERDTYRVLPRGACHEWQVRPRKAIPDQDKALALLRAMQSSEQPDLLPRDKSLAEAVAELAIETAGVPESGTSSFPNQEQKFPNREQKFPDRERKFPIREPTSKPSIYEIDRSSTREKISDRSRSDRDRDRGFESSSTERLWLLNKLRRIPRLEAEVMRPQNDFQRRISRIFWELETKDCEWLKGVIGDLADRTDVPNKAAWFNTAATTRLKAMESEQKA